MASTGSSDYHALMGPLNDSPRRVLIVDDNEDAANSLAMLLELSGHETASVYSAADALTQVAVFRPTSCCWISVCRGWMVTRSRSRYGSCRGYATSGW